MVKYKDERRFCTPEYLKKLHELGYVIEGSDREMEKILLSKGFGLPKIIDEDYDGYWFNVGKYIRLNLNRADSLAEEIILLKKLGEL